MARQLRIDNIVGILFFLLVHCTQCTAQSRFFNATALAGVKSTSVLQCWQFTSAFQQNPRFDQPDIQALSLGNLTNGTYTIFPPRADAGLHNAPSLQWVVVLSGVFHITLPNTTIGPTTEAWMEGGRYGVLFAADPKNVSRYGHFTTYPGDAATVALQLPVQDVPAHTVLYDGPCGWRELIG